MKWAKAKIKRARRLGVQRVSTSERDVIGSDVRSKSKGFGGQWYTVNSSKLKVRAWWWELGEVGVPDENLEHLPTFKDADGR